MTEDKTLSLIKRLDYLRSNHRDLDNEIRNSSLDEFSLFSKKREKLQIRDEIMALERVVYPDIIA